MTISRSLLVGLIASAALNVFLVGGVVGALWVRKDPASPLPAPAVIQSAPTPPDQTPPGQTPPSQGVSPEPPLAPLPSRLQPLRPAPTGSGEDAQLARPPLWTAGKGLSPESRRALRLTLREANQQNQPITRQARGERQAALLAFKVKPYDAAEVTKRLAAARALDVQARGNVEAALATYAATLSPVERAALADGLAQVYAPRPRPAQPGAK